MAIADITIPFTFIKAMAPGKSVTATIPAPTLDNAMEQFRAALEALSKMSAASVAEMTLTLAPPKVIDLPSPGLVDCPSEVEIQVTLMDIYKGERGNSDLCAVSRAAQRRFDGAKVSVGHDMMVVYIPGHSSAQYMAVGTDAHSFIRRFDREAHVSPCVLRYRRVI